MTNNWRSTGLSERGTSTRLELKRARVATAPTANWTDVSRLTPDRI
jgi:hypothetical protein